MASLSKVYFFFEKKGVSLKNRTKLKLFIESVFKKEKTGLKSLNYVFCSDQRILEINRQFLQHDYYTDIITFELSESGLVEAEIYISIDRVRDNAKKLSVSIISELHRVIFHGVLHLCGYGDKGAEQEKKMRKMENLYINQYFR
ncbi:MAG TPA: rRNA maturation RNase YbeY [Chitinophagaceae bacterium]|nr:rRNA maturation RNase YbeY [Chitinophagaceae bacterium]HMU58844.1 rRNA maturation RNase YbeY [Chitinophagaceae bacterium]